MQKIVNDRTLVGLRVTISRRGMKGIYVADFHHGGQHRRKSLKTTIKKVAQERAITLENQLQDGTFKTNASKTRTPEMFVEISKATEDFINFHRTEGRRRKTLVKYQGILRRFVAFATTAGVTKLASADLLLVDRYRAFRQPALSAKSMHHEGSLLKLFFGWCVERGLMPSNPLINRKFKAPQARPRGGPTLEQINAILKAASPSRRPIIAVAAFAGVRIGEIIRLRVEDVDFKGNWLHIVSRPGLETKTGQDWKVPIHTRLQKILERVPRGKSGWFFTAQPSCKYPEGDHHINPKHVGEDFAKILKLLEIAAGRDRGFTFHSLRSSFKTICINAGVPREVADVWQNHAPDRAASHVYYKLNDEDSQRFMLLVPFGDKE